MKRCAKTRYPTSPEAEAAAEALPGYRPYPCMRCGGWHLTSDGQESVRGLTAAEQAVLIVAREPCGAHVKNGKVLDGDGREVQPAAAAYALQRRGMIRIEPWGEITPRKTA